MVIKVNNVSKEFKSRGNRNLLSGLWRPEWKYANAVDEISFDIASGESVAFLGPNGAGKTTTTKMMTGLMHPSSGSIEVLGFNPFERNPKFLSQIGLVLGNKAGLNWDLTANQSFWLLKNIYDIGDDTFKSRVKRLSEILSVQDKLETQVRRLSLGERMKVELMGAILHNPKVLFLDEPTIGLDIDSKKSVRKFLREIQKDGVTLVLTSHDMDDIEEVCDRVLVINEGKIAYDDDIDKLLGKYSSKKFIRFHFKGDKPIEAINNIAKIEDDSDGLLLEVNKEDMIKVLGQVTEQFDVADIDIQSVPLEQIISDVFKA